MGCTAEALVIKTNKYIDELQKDFYEYFKDDLYYDDGYDSFETEKHKDGSGSISFDDEPFFRQSCMEDAIYDYFKTFCIKHPDIEASLDYSTEFSVDASSQWLAYSYKDYEISGETRYGYGGGYYFECECGYDNYDDDEPLFYFEDFDVNKEYKCPECGAILDTNDYGVSPLKENIKALIKEN